MDRLAATLAGMSMIGSVQMVAAILSCAVLALIFLAAQARRRISGDGVRGPPDTALHEEQTVRIEAKLDQLAQAASTRDAYAQRSEQSSRPMGPTLDEIIEKLG